MIVFGGYSPSVGTFYPEQGKTSPSRIMQTHSYSMPPLRNGNRLSLGFPTYRAQARLFADPTTGKTFLFGGYTNADYVPSRRNTISRSFGDFWQLCIDEPGGCFDDVDYDEEARTAKAGPWQRCFTCGSAGQDKMWWYASSFLFFVEHVVSNIYAKGTCKGTAFFCDSLCLKEGWKEHKERHNCRKSS